MEYSFTSQVEKWGVFEFVAEGKTDGNPFTDFDITARFENADESKTVSGFYEGNGVYKVRFMPSFEGKYTFSINGSFSDKQYSGSFEAVPPSDQNHGPVRVCNTYYFEYADGNPCYPLGTTCYVWALQSDELIAETLESLKNSPFSKIRFCILPKHYAFNLGEPRSYPYEGTPMDSSVLTMQNFYGYNENSKGNNWDFTRFNPEHFRHIEYCITELSRLGIEADIILFHPYDRWGFSKMNAEANKLYLKYVIARFSSYRNVWWSLANEYDFMQHKTSDDWESYARIIGENDPYGRMCSIHNGVNIYDFTRPWVTHCSIQRQDIYRTAENTSGWREKYEKPVVLDEIAYEGDIPYAWGNITAEELVRRFWEAAVRGGYGGHGETYLSDDGILWWSHGGKLKGESPKRITFLREIMQESPGNGLKQKAMAWDELCAVPADDEEQKRTGYHLFYYSFMRPHYREYHIDDENEYAVEIIDTWNMTVENIGVFKGWFKIELPARQYMAVRMRWVQKQ